MTKEFDIIILGASGFTGELVVEEMARIASQKENIIKWAVAGRNLYKVQRTLVQVQKNVTYDLKGIKIFEADVTEETSLQNVCKSTKLVINCIGPFEKYGEPVVKACLKYRTHIIDMTIEIMFMNRMMLKYYDEAESKGVYVVSACGVGYLPAEMALTVLEQKFEGGIESIEIHIKPDVKPGSVHSTTWESYVNMCDSVNDALAARQLVYSNILKQSRSKWGVLGLTYPIKSSKEISGFGIHVPAFLHTTAIGMDMKTTIFKEKPVKVNCYYSLETLKSLITTVFITLVVVCLIPFAFGRRLLTKYPDIFSFGYVSQSTPEEEMKNGAVVGMVAVARGWSKKQCDGETAGNPDTTVVLHASSVPAYKFTAVCLVQAALTVLQEIDRLPNRGGIYTPLPAFCKTSLTARLQKCGMRYKVQ